MKALENVGEEVENDKRAGEDYHQYGKNREVIRPHRLDTKSCETGPGRTQFSTEIEPVMKPASNSPDKVSGAIAAFLKACFQMILRVLTPLALANLTYSESSTSNMADRTSLT